MSICLNDWRFLPVSAMAKDRQTGWFGIKQTSGRAPLPTWAIEFMALVVVANEFMANAFKHGFSDNPDCELRIFGPIGCELIFLTGRRQKTISTELW